MEKEPKFYFGDLAVVTMTGETGEVVGIWWRDDPRAVGRWVYRLSGLKRFGAAWWSEEQLLRPSEWKRQQQEVYDPAP